MSDPTFSMMTCAVGAEVPLKTEVAELGWRLAFSRPGFVTAKHDKPGADLPHGIFVRTASRSLGHLRGSDGDQLIGQLGELLSSSKPDRVFDELHVWPRDRLPIGKFGFEPELDEVSKLVAQQIVEKLPAERIKARVPNQVAAHNSCVLDVVLVDPNDWFIGWHDIGPAPDDGQHQHANGVDWPLRWPGGLQPIVPKYEPISRAYFKAAEAMDWSGFPFRERDVAVEVGSAPGGACGRMLELGLKVIGIDPADMDPRIANHPRFTHHRARAGDLPRKVFRGARWLFADSNVKPDKMLTTVENIVTHRDRTIEGLLLTFKLGDYSAAAEIPAWRTRIEQWGPSQIRVRQLARNRCEVCFAIRF
ncbi:MAG: SAM-dependent methyltransferase [Planctomycetota bacterium]